MSRGGANWPAGAILIVALVGFMLALYHEHELDAEATRPASALAAVGVRARASVASAPSTVQDEGATVPSVTAEARPHAPDPNVTARPASRAPRALPRTSPSAPSAKVSPGRASLLPPPTSAAPEPRRDTRAVLTLVVNGQAHGDTVVDLEAGEILIPLADLRRAGLVADLPEVRREARPQEALVPLGRLGAFVSHRLDQSTLTLELDVEPELFSPTRISLAGAPPAGLVHSDDASAFLNYGVHVDTYGGYSLFGELGLHLFGALFTTTVTGGSVRGPVRGLTQIVIDDRDAMARLTIGDVYAHSGRMGGGAFLAGLTYARETSIDPYFVTSPGLSFEGAARAPATVEVYVDGALVKRLDVPAGTFSLEDLPVPTKSGKARYVVRDALGGVQSFERPFVLGSRLLAPGLHDFSYSLGVERLALATESFDYGAPLLLGRHRVGIDRQLTAGWRGELTADLAGLGAELSVGLPLGQLDLGLHGSATRDGGAGGAAQIAWSVEGRGVSGAIYALGRTASYARIGAGAQTDRELADLGARLGWSFGPLRGGLEGRLTHMQELGSLVRGRLSLGWALTPGLGLQLAAGVAHGRHETGWDAFALLTFTPGRRFAGAVSQQVGSDGLETVLRTNVPMRDEEDVGMHTTAILGDEVRLFARPEARTSFGLYQLSLAYDARGLFGSADAAGAVVFVEGAGLALARPVRDAFAIVDVPEDVEVRVLRDNREIGRTRGGKKVVGDLIPYYGNRIGLAAGDLDLAHEVERTERLVAPPYRGGARVSFEVRQTRYVRGRIVLVEPGRPGRGGEVGPLASLGSGAPARRPERRELVPAYGRLVVATAPRPTLSPLGRQAEFELEGLGPGRHRATVEHRGRRCELWLNVRRPREAIEDLGLLVCQLEGGS